MSTYGGLIKEIPIIPYPCAPGSTLVRGNAVEVAGGLVVSWGGTNPLFGFCNSDADNDRNVVDVYIGKGGSFKALCDTGVVPTFGQQLGWSSAGTLKVVTTGTVAALAVGTGMNGFVEAVRV